MLQRLRFRCEELGTPGRWCHLSESGLRFCSDLIYNPNMNENLLQYAEGKASEWWFNIRRVYPVLPQARPIVKLNNRLKTTAGRAWYEENYIELSTELLCEHPAHFATDTIPHELAHIAAWHIFKDPGHGKGWKTVIAACKIRTTRLHTLINSAHAARRAGAL